MARFESLAAMALVAVSLSACSGSGGGDADDGGAACSADSDCKGDRVCQSGECVDPGSGGGSSNNGPTTGTGAGGPTCDEVGTACTGETCCGTAICVNYGGTLGSACGDVCDTGSDCQSGCCGGLQNGGGACAPAEYCSLGVVCDSVNHCTTDVCNGWCTDYCTNSNQCAGDSWCMETTGGDQYCYMGCDSSSDCAVYPGTSCQTYTTVDNISVDICSY